MNISSFLGDYALIDRIDTLVILEFVLQKDRAWILAHGDYELNAKQQQKFEQLVKKRVNGKPLAYIIGTKEFYGHDFYVTKDVLVPRPESEAFLDLLDDYKPLPSQSLIDVGTGSGALGISAKIAYPFIQVTATDISKHALKVAQKNAAHLNVDVKFVRSDLFSYIDFKYDYIFANLPYVPTNFDVSAEVLSEPSIAVFSGQDGLDCIKMFIPQATQHCNKLGYVFIESLKIQHKKVKDLANNYNLKLVNTNNLVQVYQKTN
ncbi:peptide chain release factor N(5)-glutamine methyltransferase [Candidatus Saccharibacteria bacterium]|nr:peptide chain release factor N(5)-glutamine methyltransferase [Candidatus Saccharibacteria bacterium]MDQ5885245.1 release factor glutamine methyltransferase [Patescibacteria group bacterium]MDQ5954038.1 release factor glutamine methyltransferase [Patescibacteria group bacterium]MDQ5958901.1 release factor glutamine methyltransferase [Patescibacteria group bacterium]